MCRPKNLRIDKVHFDEITADDLSFVKYKEVLMKDNVFNEKRDRIWYDNDNNRIEMINDHKWKTALQKMQLKNLSCLKFNIKC